MLLGSKYIHINSANRTSGDINNFNLNFPSKMFNTNFNSTYYKLNLEEINIKYSWYNVTNDNGKFSTNDGSSETFLRLSEGNYNVNVVLEALNSSLTTYNVTYNPLKNTFEFSALDPLYSFTCVSIGWMLGLEDNIEYVGDFESLKPVTMQYADVLYLHSDMPRLHDAVDNIDKEKFTQSTIIATIPINLKPFDNIHYKPHQNTNEGVYIAIKNFDGFNFWITTEKGSIKLNHDWTCTLRLEARLYPLKKNNNIRKN